MSDLIDRQAAIDAVSDALKRVFVEHEDVAEKTLCKVPSTQPERKKGKWIVYYECPKCGEITKDFTEYCPFCNADMRGEEDE